MAHIDLSGGRYGRLVVIERGPNIRGEIAYLCRCDCGITAHVLAYHLRSGNSRSCGCAHSGGDRTTHGLRGHELYEIWSSMIKRCTNENATQWRYYGGRGIKVCDRWRHDFAAFLADMGERPPGLTLERIDVNGNYEPGNCKWATWSEQRRNRRDKVTDHGQQA